SVSLIFSADVIDGEENPLLEKVNARLQLLGKEDKLDIEKKILINNDGEGNIEHLNEGKWHINYWNIPSAAELYFDKNDNSINVIRTGDCLHEPAPFYAGVSDFDCIPNKLVRLTLKPQTGVLTIVLILDDATNLPETVSGVLSGIVSKRVFGVQEMNISEQGIGYVPCLFTPSSCSPPTYVASHRLLGISNTQKCELVFSNDTISPVKIDLTTELQTFNNLATNHTLCRVFYNGKKMEATIEVIDWEE
ncbi:hypothetical protein EZS27_040907, partial [termite gut metagenome]